MLTLKWLTFIGLGALLLVYTASGGVLVEKDVIDLSLTGTGTCNGKTLNITLENEYRGYCQSNCYGRHLAHTLAHFRGPVAKKSSAGQYSVIRHNNFPATCDNGATIEVISFEYINATSCTCIELLVKAI